MGTKTFTEKEHQSVWKLQELSMTKNIEEKSDKRHKRLSLKSETLKTKKNAIDLSCGKANVAKGIGETKMKSTLGIVNVS